MPISGKYDFKGIKKTGRLALKAALATNPSTAWLSKGGAIIDLVLEFGLNWLANKGLVLMNVSVYYVGGKLDKDALDKAIGAGIDVVDSGKVLTPEQMKEIDDAVIKAADKALPYGRKPTKP